MKLSVSAGPWRSRLSWHTALKRSLSRQRSPRQTGRRLLPSLLRAALKDSNCERSSNLSWLIPWERARFDGISCVLQRLCRSEGHTRASTSCARNIAVYTPSLNIPSGFTQRTYRKSTSSNDRLVQQYLWTWSIYGRIPESTASTQTAG